MVKYIGLDIGGTNIRVGAINENENIIFEYKEPTFKDVACVEALYFKIINLIKKVPNYEICKAIGIGLPGSIDKNNNTIITCRNVPLLKGYPLVEKLTCEFGKPVFIENDARVAALAEALAGKGKNKDIVSYITISTGLGGGTVINKKLFYGSSNLGSYFSRMLLDGKNTSDSLISGTALINMAKSKINQETKSVEELFKLSVNGNTIAQKIVEDFKHNLLVLLLNISSTINPDIIVLGGGVLNFKSYFIDSIKDDFKKAAHPLAQNTIIDVAQFSEPGILGACLLAKMNR